MKKILCFVFTTMLAASVCRGGSVQWNVAQLINFFGPLISIKAPNGTGTGLGVDITPHDTYATIKNNFGGLASNRVTFLPTYNETLIDQNLFLNTTDPFLTHTMYQAHV